MDHSDEYDLPRMGLWLTMPNAGDGEQSATTVMRVPGGLLVRVEAWGRAAVSASVAFVPCEPHQQDDFLRQAGVVTSPGLRP